MSALQKPKFRELNHGECAGAPILKSLWDRFDLLNHLLLNFLNTLLKQKKEHVWLIIKVKYLEKQR